ncbi:hypothetical protein [Fructobacillus fructosus]|uniref:phosphoribosylanthranilate isomerase n=1 Tax=Fructobacillus fructosus TaxID=1631 RepID=UPI002D963CE2|nr:Tryptophan synthase beta chain (TrpB) [Fructobacillus fructosus]CAK1238133.1 Tryptophan synthase beta chain (TrpB) [Fructobacillus fructosus]CAK1239390.1 Tryptophan synthase beta chain (TrpB) [Fructobacillus fructosus]
MTKIKICGLMTRADAEAVNQAQPDFAGVVFATGRHRVTIEQAELIRTTLNDQIPLVGVFTDQSVETILSLYRKKIIQIVQLHSPRERKDVERLKAEGVSLIQVAVGFEQIKKWLTTLKMFQIIG